MVPLKGRKKKQLVFRVKKNRKLGKNRKIKTQLKQGNKLALRRGSAAEKELGIIQVKTGKWLVERRVMLSGINNSHSKTNRVRLRHFQFKEEKHYDSP